MIKFIKSFYSYLFGRKHHNSKRAMLLMDVKVVRIVYVGPESKELYRMDFKNRARCLDMLNFIFEEVNFQQERGAYSLEYYDLSDEEPILKRTYYTDQDSPRTWYYLANFQGF